jgi:hypothetical protein
VKRIKHTRTKRRIFSLTLNAHGKPVRASVAQEVPYNGAPLRPIFRNVSFSHKPVFRPVSAFTNRVRGSGLAAYPLEPNYGSLTRTLSRQYFVGHKAVIDLFLPPEIVVD